MKPGKFDGKNICKNKVFSARKNGIAFGRQKSPCIAAVGGGFTPENSTKRAVMLSENAYDRR